MPPAAGENQAVRIDRAAMRSRFAHRHVFDFDGFCLSDRISEAGECLGCRGGDAWRRRPGHRTAIFHGRRIGKPDHGQVTGKRFGNVCLRGLGVPLVEIGRSEVAPGLAVPLHPGWVQVADFLDPLAGPWQTNAKQLAYPRTVNAPFPNQQKLQKGKALLRAVVPLVHALFHML